MVNAQATVIKANGHAIDAVAEAMLDLKVEVDEGGWRRAAAINPKGFKRPFGFILVAQLQFWPTAIKDKC